MLRYSGAGNTFLLADNRQKFFDYRSVSDLCANNSVDGVILAEDSMQSDAFMRIFNADGSEAEMCGNGLRCFIHFLKSLGIHKEIYEIETLAGSQKGWFVNEEVNVQLSPPTGLKLHIDHNLHFLNTGVPHAVTFFESLETIDVAEQGRDLRFSPLFAPTGANINFVCIQKNGSLTIRTYERGVERETLACGTGAAASALIASHLYLLSSPIPVWVRSKERLVVSFSPDWSFVAVQGPVIVDKLF